MASSLSLSSRRNLWDPYQVLDVYPNSRKSSCVGLAIGTGRRCRWSFDTVQFSNSQMATAVQQLDSMAAVHPSDVTPAELRSLAQNTLCRTYHQGQVHNVEREWLATIDAYVRENREVLALGVEVRQLAIDIVRVREEAKTDVRKAHQALEASQSRCSDLVEKNDRLEGEHAASSQDFALLRRQLAELQTDAKTRDDLNSRVEKQKRLTDERHASFEKYAAARSNEMKALREKLEASGREIADLQEAKASLEKNADLSEQEAERTRQELQTSNNRHNDLETRSSDLEQKYAESKKEKIEQDRKIGQLDKRIDSMRRDLDKSKVEISAHTSKLREQDLDMKQLVEQMGILNKTLTEREENQSSFQPQKRGLFAKFSRQPPRVAATQISGIMTAESSAYVQSAA